MKPKTLTFEMHNPKLEVLDPNSGEWVEVTGIVGHIDFGFEVSDQSSVFGLERRSDGQLRLRIRVDFNVNPHLHPRTCPGCGRESHFCYTSIAEAMKQTPICWDEKSCPNQEEISTVFEHNTRQTN